MFSNNDNYYDDPTAGFYNEPEPESKPDDENDRPTPRRLTRQGRLQAAADAGYDTWDDYNGEK